MAARVPVGPDDIRWGDEQAPVTAVIFGQLSARSSLSVLRRLNRAQKAVGPGVLRIVWKFHSVQTQVPHEGSLARVALGVAALAGGEVARDFLAAAGARFHELNTTDKALEAARALGIQQIEALAGRLESAADEAKLRQDEALGVRLNVARAPVIFVNGFRLGGMVKEADIREVVLEEARQAEELLRGGKGHDVYALRTHHNAGNEHNAPWEVPRLAPGEYRRVPLGDAPTLGSPKAPVTMVVFGGYQDPFSQRLWTTVEALRKRYKDDLRIAWKDAPLPFHRASLPLAAMARERRAVGGDAAFWLAHSKLLSQEFWQRNRGGLTQTEIPSSTLDAVAREVGLSSGAVLSRHQARIEADRLLWSELGGSGTPASFLNGQFLSGAQPEARFREVIDGELARARERLRAGVRPEELYSILMAEIPDGDED
jgi:protein-disulfide isomerase